MIVLPVVDRELRVAARRSGTYRTRLWAAGAAIALAAWKCLGWAWQGVSAESQGSALFYTLAGFAFVYALVIGARVTADCISEEKREGTLGLLFLTDLKGWHVVAGKLVASSLNAVYGLVAVLPLLAIPLLLGGVDLGEFIRVVIALLSALSFSLSTGLFVSALSQNERKATSGTLLAVVGWCTAPIYVVLFYWAVLEQVGVVEDLAPFIPWLMLSPVYPLLLFIRLPLLGYLPASPWTFWESVAVVQVLSFSLLLLTSKLLPQAWKDRPRPAKPSIRVSVMEQLWDWAQGDADQRRRFRTRLLNIHPYLWLVSRDRLKPAYAWLFAFSMVAMWLWGYAKYGSVMLDFYPLAPTLLLIHGFLKVWVVTEVSHRLVEDQRKGALELLLSTSLTREDLYQGQKRALLRQFAWPVLALCAMEVLAFHSAYSLRQLLPVLLVLVADLSTLFPVALRLSLTARNINEVLLKSLFLVLVLPWLVYFLMWPAWHSVFHAHDYARFHPSFTQRLHCWFAVALVNDFVWGFLWARPETPRRCAEAVKTALRGLWRVSVKTADWHRNDGRKQSVVGFRSAVSAASEDHKAAQPGVSSCREQRPSRRD